MLTAESLQKGSTSLQAAVERQFAEIEQLGDLYRDNGLVFTSGVGTLINPTNLRRRAFAHLLQKAGLPQIRFHDLRHTCATLLFSKGAHPKYVLELLGHATVAITLDAYSHVIPGMGNYAARHGRRFLLENIPTVVKLSSRKASRGSDSLQARCVSPANQRFY